MRWVRRSALHETAAVVVTLIALAALVYGSYISRGGFVTDPWVVEAWYKFSPEHGVLALSREYIEYNSLGVSRSLDFVRLATQSSVFGADMTLWLAWQVAMSVIMSTGLFLLLRKLRLPWFHAGVIAVLILVFPAATSIRVWAISGAPAAITLATFGFLVAVNAFDSRGPKQIVLHGVSLALFVASALLYEVAFFVMLASVLVYRFHVPWGLALRRWAVDFPVLVVVGAILRAKASLKGHQDLGGMLSHAGTIADQALTLFMRSVLPLGDVDRWLVLGLVVVIPIAAIVMINRLPSTAWASSVRVWLWVLVAGLAVVVLGYVPFVAADDYYEPLAPGIGNRVNAVSGIGFVLILYALAMLLTALIERRRPRSRVLAPAVALLVFFAVLPSWFRAVNREEDAFVRAHDEIERVAHTVKLAIPNPLPASTIWTFGQPVEIKPGVPIFDQWGSMRDRVRLAYDDPTLESFVDFPGTSFECGPTAIIPQGPLYEAAAVDATSESGVSPYGRTYFVDTVTGHSELIETPHNCRRAAKRFPQSPYFASEPVPLVPVAELLRPRYRLQADGAVIVGPDDQRIPVRAGTVNGSVDNAASEGDVVDVTGWAVSGDSMRPVGLVVGVVDGSGIVQAVPRGERPDVVEALGNDAVKYSGFGFAIAVSSLECGAPASGLTLYGVVDGVAAPLPMIGNSERILERACR